jgi:hypothetical protein
MTSRFSASRCDRLAGQLLGRSCLSRLSTLKLTSQKLRLQFKEKSNLEKKRYCQSDTSTLIFLGHEAFTRAAPAVSRFSIPTRAIASHSAPVAFSGKKDLLAVR